MEDYGEDRIDWRQVLRSVHFGYQGFPKKSLGNIPSVSAAFRFSRCLSAGLLQLLPRAYRLRCGCLFPLGIYQNQKSPHTFVARLLDDGRTFLPVGIRRAPVRCPRVVVRHIRKKAKIFVVHCLSGAYPCARPFYGPNRRDRLSCRCIHPKNVL